MNNISKQYEIALSFSGKQRDYVRNVAGFLREKGILLFYDEFEEANLWGKNLVEHLHLVYSEYADFCVIFISKEYVEGMWTTHEKRSAFEASLARNREYILPARFDDSRLVGLPATTAYLDCRTRSPQQIAEIILEKLGKNTESIETATRTRQTADYDSILTVIKRLSGSYRNSRVPIEVIAKDSGVLPDVLKDSLVKLYYRGAIEFHSGNRCSITR